MNGIEHGQEIANKMYELNNAFDEQLNRHNEYFDKYSDGALEETAAACMIDDDDFIAEYLRDEVIALARAVLNAHWHGKYACGVGVVGKTREECQAKEIQNRNDFYDAVNNGIKKGVD